MQVLGLILLFIVIGIGFMEREMTQVSSFDLHALGIITLGCVSATMVSSSFKTFVRTFTTLGELLPGRGKTVQESLEMEGERKKLEEMWLSGRRSQAVELAERSRFRSTKEVLDLLLRRASRPTIENMFFELRQEESSKLLPAQSNWELMSKLGPSFGMVGTITGMIQLFKVLGAEDANLGAAMSLALLATLYGVAFGAGVAGPIGHRLGGILDDRLDVLDRCEKSVYHLLSVGDGK